MRGGRSGCGGVKGGGGNETGTFPTVDRKSRRDQQRRGRVVEHRDGKRGAQFHVVDAQFLRAVPGKPVVVQVDVLHEPLHRGQAHRRTARLEVRVLRQQGAGRIAGRCIRVPVGRRRLSRGAKDGRRQRAEGGRRRIAGRWIGRRGRTRRRARGAQRRRGCGRRRAGRRRWIGRRCRGLGGSRCRWRRVGGDVGGDGVGGASGVDAGTWASGVANCTRWANAGQQAKAHSTAASSQTIRVVFTTTPPCSFEGTRREDDVENRTPSIPRDVRRVKSGCRRAGRAAEKADGWSIWDEWEWPALTAAICPFIMAAQCPPGTHHHGKPTGSKRRSAVPTT